MTEFGQAKIDAAKRSGRWAIDPHPVTGPEAPPDLSAELARNQKAKVFFERLAPSYRRHFIAWILSAKRPDTRAKRLDASLALLARGEKLGLK